MSSSDDIVGDEGPPPPSRPPRKANLQGPMCIFLVVACASGFWDECQKEDLPPSWAGSTEELGRIVGIVCAPRWSLVFSNAQAGSDSQASLRSLSLRATRGTSHFGFVEYPVQAWARLQEPARMMAGSAKAILEGLAGLAVASSEDSSGMGATVGSVVQSWKLNGVRNIGPIVRLAPHFAWQVLSGAWKCLHCVAVIGKTNRQRLLEPRQPSRKQLAQFLATALDAGLGAAAERRGSSRDGPEKRSANLGWLGQMKEAALVIDWLDASRYIKNIRQCGEAAQSFGRIFARSSGITLHALTNDLKEAQPELLRRARVRLDCVAMLLNRRLWTSIVRAQGDDLPNLYLFADASPQWRQLELYAASFDLKDGDTIIHKLFPALALDKWSRDAFGKCVALLWQIFLVAGPSYFLVKLWCSRVRSVTTDQGVERMLADYPGFLGDFFWLVDPKYKIKDANPPLANLFPRALAMPGWQHMWDLLMRRGLTQMRFFPQWITGLKAIVNFLRSVANSSVVVRSLRQKGLDGAADMIEQASLPSFAEWRWGTLLLCCNRLALFLDTLIANFDAALFRDCKDRVGITTMLAALRSTVWRKQFDFVKWFCNWLGGIMAWGKGCDCHEEALRGGADIECSMKGRRLKKAYVHAAAELRSGLDAANEWTVHTWDLGAESLLDFQACVRGTYELALRKLGFLDKIPYLLARLADPGVRDRCVAQWAACAPEGHHRVSHEFLSPTGALRPLVDAMRQDGTQIAPALQREIDSLGCIPMDDSIAESPHASASRHMQHARGAKWPWIASTMRLQQNLDDVRNIPAATGADLDVAWASYKSVVQGPSARASRSATVRGVKTKKFLADVYTMAFALEGAPEVRRDTRAAGAGEPGGSDDGKSSDDNDGQPPGGGGRGLKRGLPGDGVHLGAGASGSAGPLVHPSLGTSSGGGVGGGLVALRRTEETKLLRQFFAACLTAPSFVSLRVVNEEGKHVHCFFQVLSRETKPILVKTYEDYGGEQEQGLYTVSVQPYERLCGGRPQVFRTDDQAMHNVFAVRDPCLLDILLLAGGRESRPHWWRWTPGLSDLDGCISLASPEPWAPKLPLTSPCIPVLSLLDVLHDRGWASRDEMVNHQSPSWKAYDHRNIVSQRCYLQCLVSIDELLPLVGPFPSGQPQAFYALMLKGKKPVQPGQGAKAYFKALALAGGDLVEAAALSSEDALARSTHVSRAPPAIADDDGSESVFGDDGGADETLAMVPEPQPPQPAQPMADDADDVVGDDGVIVAHRPVPASVEWPETLLGQAVRQVSGRSGSKWSYHPRLSVTCGNPAHDRCAKSRSTAMEVETYGRLASVYYLGAWLQRSDLPAEAHRQYAPSRDEVRAFAASYSA